MAKLTDQEKIIALTKKRQNVDIEEFQKLLDGACPGCGLSMRRPEGYPPKWYSISGGHGQGGELFCKQCCADFEEKFRDHQKSIKKVIDNL